MMLGPACRLSSLLFAGMTMVADPACAEIVRATLSVTATVMACEASTQALNQGDGRETRIVVNVALACASNQPWSVSTDRDAAPSAAKASAANMMIRGRGTGDRQLLSLYHKSSTDEAGHGIQFVTVAY
ncbi:MAG: hypothetical protein JWN69_2598 [Alphaproteobacteria bacterium]|nr:hypothetical protein [Alphaproteobacteria bacterium]